MVWGIDLWQLILLGGPIMVPILIASIIALAISMERAFFFASIRENSSGLKSGIYDAIRKNDVKTALAVCDRSATPLANVLRAGILQYGKSRTEVMEAMQEVSAFEVSRLERRIPMLALVAHVAPLMGLLGTVTGLMTSFHSIQMRSAGMGTMAVGDFAGGVWEALITTVAGLTVAIPVLLAHGCFVEQMNRYVFRMERVAVDVANFLTAMAASGGPAE